MAGFRWIVTSSFLMLQVLSCRAACGERSSFTVRDGDEVTLPCWDVIHDQDECNITTWLFRGSGKGVTLFENGKIHKEAEAKSDRLSVSENCSLVIKNVTDEDAGKYTCSQFRSGEQRYAWTYLCVVTMTEQKNNDEVTFICSMATDGGCTHKVKWMYEGNQSDVVTSRRRCSAWLRINKSHLDQKLKSYELLKCEVTFGFIGGVHQFPFSPPQSSGDAPTTTTTKSPTRILSTATIRNKSEVTNNKTSENNLNEKKPEAWWWRCGLIVVSVGLAALIIVVVTVNIWTRTKVNKTRMAEIIERHEEEEEEEEEEGEL